MCIGIILGLMIVVITAIIVLSNECQGMGAVRIGFWKGMVGGGFLAVLFISFVDNMQLASWWSEKVASMNEAQTAQMANYKAKACTVPVIVQPQTQVGQ